MCDEVPDPALVMELVRAAAGSLVMDDDAEPTGEKGRLAQALGEGRVVELVSSKISASGRKVIDVPVAFVALPFASGARGLPRS